MYGGMSILNAVKHAIIHTYNHAYICAYITHAFIYDHTYNRMYNHTHVSVIFLVTGRKLKFYPVFVLVQISWMIQDSAW